MMTRSEEHSARLGTLLAMLVRWSEKKSGYVRRESVRNSLRDNKNGA
jgi:hypothetical protein